ncbi:MAG: hypothetical protein BWY59_00583 [Verrucomicrobia bacterium ADurb.Bin345]|nr:MAG: hypothetical protein BWY59_00583 [Verrucomicrobia bacterium ADurb.Bin345]
MLFEIGTGTNDHGGFLQDYTIEGTVSRRYLFAVRGTEGENDFDAGLLQIGLEFLDSTGAQIYSVQKSLVGLLTSDWQTFYISATSTVGAVTVRPTVMFNSFDNVEGTVGRTSMWDNAMLYWATVAETNPILRVTDGQLAAVGASDPFRVEINAYDAYSGLSRGTSSAETQMNISVQNLASNNVANYTAAQSSSDSRDVDTTNSWVWSSAFSAAAIQSFMDAPSNIVLVTLRDADVDRTGDQYSLSNRTAGYFMVFDDDDAAPSITDIYSVSNFVTTFRSLHVTLNATDKFLSGSTTNRLYRVTDGDLANLSATNILRLSFGVNDTAGIFRDAGESDTNAAMSITVGTVLQNNFANYYEDESTPDPAAGVSTNVWRFESAFAIGQIDALYAVSSNTVFATIPDRDNDRANDSMTRYSQQYGHLSVIDDDSAAPILSGFTIPESAEGDSGATELFISEYVEGSSNNKAIEIYNGTGADIDLAAGSYYLMFYYNGATTSTRSISLAGTITNGKTWVVTQNNAAEGITNKANQIESLTGWFSGDDAVVLRKGGTNGTVLDCVGQVGNDPGTAWTSGLLSTAEQTLRRKSSVSEGNTNYLDAFETLLGTEWDGYAQDNFDGLGEHTLTGGGESILTDAMIREGGYTLTGTVQDVSSGIYVTGGNAPSFSMYNSVGTVLESATVFDNGPAANGDARASAEGLWHVLDGAAYDDVTIGTYTALIFATDYDFDRTDDALSTTSSFTFVVMDDDSAAPMVGGLRFNRLRNPSFEDWIDGAGNSAAYWQNMVPDENGNMTGNYMRTNAHPWTGVWNMSIPGHWGIHGAPYGVHSQEVENDMGAGSVWEASVRMWRDSAFTANVIRLSIDFLDDEKNVLYWETAVVSPPADTWYTCSLVGTASVDVAWVRWILRAEDVCEVEGSHLHYDDAFLGSYTGAVFAARIGATNYYFSSTTNTNGVVTITDGDLATVSEANPFFLMFGAFDPDSGLSRGTTDSGSQMNITVGSWMSDNVQNFSAFDSSESSATLLDGAVNAWRWTNFGYTTIGDLCDAGSNWVGANLFDDDDDRPSDRMSNLDQQYGHLLVLDDDTNAPALGISGVTNLLRNGNFEIDGTTDYAAWGWEWGNPDQNAGVWGNTIHPDTWPQARSGTRLGAIPGLWGWDPITNTNGGWWQQASNGWAAGTVWEAGTWVWNDDGTGGGPVWTSATRGLKIEFYDVNGAPIPAADNANLFAAPGETWTWVSVLATAPVNAAWARFVIYAEGVSTAADSGALQFDDAILRPLVPFGVQVGNRYIRPDNGDTSVNANYALTDRDVATVGATNPLKLIFGVYDADTGLSRGTSDVSTQMNVSVENLVTNNVSLYSTNASSPFSATFSSDAYSVWQWETMTSEQMASMIAAGSNEVTATIFDADDDRANDRLSLPGQRFGFLRVVDNDTQVPIASNLLVNGELANETTLTDQQLRVGNWQIAFTFYDASGIATQNVGDYWEPNFSLISPSGVTTHQQYGFTDDGGFSTSDGRTFTAWRNWAGGVLFDQVETGYWQVVWSARDLDEDRDGDWMAVTNTHLIGGSSNLILVVDDDSVAPTAPSNIVVNPVNWTNRNYFEVTWAPAYDVSGIYEYRSYTNASVPAWTSGVLLTGGSVVTSVVPHTMTNMNFEIGEDGEVVPHFGDTSPWGWVNFGAASPSSDGWWDDSDTQDGTNSMRVVVRAPGTHWALVGQDVLIDNENNYGGEVRFSGWFKGDMSHGSGGGGFLKLEFYDESDAMIPPIIGNEYDDGFNGRPLFDVNVVDWTNVTVIATNMPPSTRKLRVMVGLNNFASGLSFTGWWDNISLTVKLVSASGELGGIFTNAPLGAITNYVYAVDADNDRNEDRLMGPTTNFVTRFDNLAPPKIGGLNATPGYDDAMEVILMWTPLNDHSTAGGGTNLSPWYSYQVFWNETNSPTTNDPSITWEDGYFSLATNITATITLSNGVPGTSLRYGIAGRDSAGNLGPISDPITNIFTGFNMTQGVMNASGYPQFFWTAATNESGQVVREYDLLFCDAMNFTAALTTQWKRLASGYTHTLMDTGGLVYVEGQGYVYVTPPSELVNTMRFYRAAAHDRWMTNNNPRIATEEIYGVKTFRLYRGQNWVSLPFVPDANTIMGVFGTNVVGGSDPGESTVISWYYRVDTESSSHQVWLDTGGSVPTWRYSGPETNWNDSANDVTVPIHDGFIVEVRPDAPEPQVVTFIGRVPTNRMTQAVGGMRHYHLVGFNQPLWVHPSQLGLLQSGFRGGTFPTSSDRIWAFNRVTQRTKADIWYRTTDNTWRYNLTPSFPVVQSWERPFGPDDALVILTSPTNTAYWTWTNQLLYTPPTRTMSP